MLRSPYFYIYKRSNIHSGSLIQSQACMGKKSRSFMTQRNNLLGGRRKITKRFFNLIKSIPVVFG